ncbi:hypothetical protein [Pseudoalteromonas sp. GB43]
MLLSLWSDIPQFEYYREFDKTTVEFDKANGRPKYFWYRVDKSFLKKMSPRIQVRSAPLAKLGCFA